MGPTQTRRTTPDQLRQDFAGALDITLSELAIESFYPADAATTAYLRERKN